VDNSLIAIVVLALIVWEFIQRTIPEKAHRDNASHGTDAAGEASFEEAKNTLLSSDDNVKP